MAIQIPVATAYSQEAHMALSELYRTSAQRLRALDHQGKFLDPPDRGGVETFMRIIVDDYITNGETTVPFSAFGKDVTDAL